jgi:CRP-like cAMP-binding protein
VKALTATGGIGADDIGNLLLRSLPDEDRNLLIPHLERVPFQVDDVIAQAGEPITSICFPEAAIAAVLDAVEEGPRRLAVGLVGREGFLGWPLLMGDDRWPHDVVMRADSGTALRIDAGHFLEILAQSDTLRVRMLRFANVFMTQMARTIVSSLVHPVERRMARWILLYHDRLSADEICMTHEEFRLMLGVRRSSVTEALHRLEEYHAVRALRGRVIVRDRDKLSELAGDTYGQPEREYQRLILTDGDAAGERAVPYAIA